MRTQMRRERGVVLFIALIVLVAMSLAGVAMMRTVTGGVLVAGNLGFKRVAVAAADLGVEVARQWLLAPGGSLAAAQTGYVLTWDTAFDAAGYAWTSGSRDAMARVPTALRPAGIESVRYVVHRLCAGAGAVDPKSCVVDTGGASTSSMREALYGPGALAGASAVMYRVTVRVIGVKGTTSYVQALSVLAEARKIRFAGDAMMNTTIPHESSRARRGVARFVLATFLAQTLLPSAYATDISPVPLITAGAERAKPNFLLTLDDSTSMNLEYMPGEPDSSTDYKPFHAGMYSSECNKIYFNPDPAITYPLPPDPSSATFDPFAATRTDWNAAPLDGFNPVVPLRDLNQPGSSGGFTINTHDTDKGFYLRFAPAAPITFNPDRHCRVTLTFDGSGRAQDTTIVDTTVTPNVTQGTWKVENINAGDRQRFARWFSFYRTRLNVMKSSAGLAFSYPTVDKRLRIGFVTTTPSADGRYADRTTAVHPDRFLPVRDFDDNWKREWLKKLYSTTAQGDTPLRLALSRAGWYFAGRKDGPSKGMIYSSLDPTTGESTAGAAPEKFMGDPVKYACQRNYTLVVTDGYWNGDQGVKTWTSSPVTTSGPATACSSPSSSSCDIRTQDSGSLAAIAAPFNDTVRLFKTDRRAVDQVSFTGQDYFSDRSGTRCSGNAVGNPVVGSYPGIDLSTMNVYKCRPGGCDPGLPGGGFDVAYQLTGIANAANAVSVTIPLATGISAPPVTSGGARVEQEVVVPRFAEIWHQAQKVELFNLIPKGYTRPLVPYGADELISAKLDLTPTYPDDAPDGTFISRVLSVRYPPAAGNRFGLPSGGAGQGQVFERVTGNTGLFHKYLDTDWEWWRTPKARVPGDATKLQSRVNAPFFAGCSRIGIMCWPTEGGNWACSSMEDSTRVELSAEPPAAPASFPGVATNDGSISGNHRGSAETPIPGPPLEVPADKYSESFVDGGLADVAAYFYNTPLRVGVDTTRGMDFTKTKVPPLGTGPEDDFAPHLHMTTFTMGLGVTGFLKYNPRYRDASIAGNEFNDIRKGFSADDLATSGAKVWPPLYRAHVDAKIDDLWHAAVNGHGLYLGANNANEVRDRLTDALTVIQARPGGGSGATGSSNEPKNTDKQVFWTNYMSDSWSGDLIMRFLETNPLDPKYGTLIDPAYNAKTALAARAAEACDSREIWLMKGQSLANFAWSGQTARCAGAAPSRVATYAFNGMTITDTDLAPLDPTDARWRSPAGSASASASIYKDNTSGRRVWDLINWIRGHSGMEYGQTDETKERFRSRSGATDRAILGDIVGSQPTYVQASPFNYSDSGHTTFRTSIASRSAMIYVGANDGMLHAFTAGNPDSSVLSDPARLAEAWAIIPSQIAPYVGETAQRDYASKHRWLIDGTPVAGDTFGVTLAAGTAAWRTTLVTGLGAGGAGYFALDVTDPLNPKPLWEVSNPGSAGCADADNLTSGRHVDCKMGQSFGNPMIAKVRSSDTATYPSGRWVVMFASGYNTPDGKGYLHVRDAGTGAKLFRFEIPLVPTAGTEVGLSKISAFVKRAAANNLAEAIYAGDLLGNVWKFDMSADIESWGGVSTKVSKVASLVAGAPAAGQPITTAIELGQSGGYPMLFVASGRYLGDTDLTTTQTQSMYGIIDKGAATAITRADLNPRSFTASTGTASVADFTGTDTGNGWYIDMPTTGERIVTDPRLQLGTLVFLSSAPSSDPCEPGGTGYLNFVDFRTGSFVAGAGGANTARVPLASGMGMGASLFRMPDGSIIDITPLSSAVKPTSTSVPINPSSVTGRRISWREIIP